MNVKIIVICLVLSISVDLAYQEEEDTSVEQSQEWGQRHNESIFENERKELSSAEESSEESDKDNSGKSRIIKRQVIKIPSGVTKVKVIAPKRVPQVRPKRISPSSHASIYSGHERKRPPKRYSYKRPGTDIDDDHDENDEPKHHRIRDVDGRRGRTQQRKSKIVVKEVTPEEFYSDHDEFQYLSTSGVESYQSSGKHSRKRHSRKSHKNAHQGNQDEVNEHRSGRKPSLQQDSDFEGARHEAEYSSPVRYAGLRPETIHGSSDHKYEFEEYQASNVHMKQVPAPNLTGLNIIDPPDMLKEAKPTSIRVAKEVTADYPLRKDSGFPPQYTSHNPLVVTNFGLEDNKSKTKSYLPSKHEFTYFDTSSRGFETTPVRYNQQTTAASEQNGVVVPSGNNGLRVVQPPQLGADQANVQTMPTQSETSRANQRATIRDILQEDCPDYEVLGYCSSPPRYPTIQITNMAMRCLELQDIMNSPIPPEPQDDLTSFSRRYDDDEDIIFYELNDTQSNESFNSKPEKSWSRSGSDSETACSSEYTIIEPGYAREVSTGKWFVIVQNSDSSLQKVTTDTCLSPGKPCGGLAGMKCSRNRGFHSGIKSTRCIQRYTHQRLISWDPESPNKCPRIRVFRFPTACVCHLRLM